MLWRAVIVAVCVTGGLAVLHPDDARAGSTMPRGSGDIGTWNLDLTTGFDTFTHSYFLTTADTSETVSEFMVQAGVEGRSPATSSDRWRLRAEASAGSDLWRERLEADWRRLDTSGNARLRASGRLLGRQYRRSTDYSRSSDHTEGRTDVQVVPVAGRAAELALIGWGGFTNYRSTSPFEQNLREVGTGLGARSRGFAGTQWALTLRRAARSYADSAAINRRTWSLEGDLNQRSVAGAEARLYHRSERRLVADPNVRPDAWSHWTDAQAALPVADGQIFVDLQSERWVYGRETPVYIDNWRLTGLLGYRHGDILNVQGQLGLVAERFAAGDHPESYDQAGVRVGAESYGAGVSGSISLEYGRRTYVGADSSALPVTDLDPFETSLRYSDFNYWKLWVLAEWRLGAQTSLEALASWEPERHSERTDDAALGFGSLRFVWRP